MELGCGVGLVGLSLLTTLRAPDVAIHLTDSNDAALQVCRRNLAAVSANINSSSRNDDEKPSVSVFKLDWLDEPGATHAPESAAALGADERVRAPPSKQRRLSASCAQSTAT